MSVATPEIRVVLKDVDKGIVSLKDYERHGGYQALRKALKMPQDAIIKEVSDSGLRGMGGAGFPAGKKWSFIPKNHNGPIYLVCNADESEPGTCKDREILLKCPHRMIEGMIIGSFAIRATMTFCYIRGEFWEPYLAVKKAMEEAYAAGYLGKNILGSGFNLEMRLYRGAGAYICGEETGLLESLEGKRGEPRVKPPFPAIKGAFGHPTVVNNVETLARVPVIVEKGANEYRKCGTAQSPGTKLFCLSGHVNKPGVYELPMGIPLREMIYEHAGGIPNGRTLKAVIPGGSSMPAFTKEEAEKVTMDFEAVRAAGSMLGSGGVIVMDDTTDIPLVTARITKFYEHESCGQCTPCREGTGWARKVLYRVAAGDGQPEDLDLLIRIANGIEGNTLCALGDAAAWPIQAFVKKFRADFEARIKRPAAVS